MSRQVAVTLGILILSGIGGCRDDSPTTSSSTSDPAAVVSQTVTPDPATARPDDSGYQWAAQFHMTLSQSGADAITIRSLSVDLQQAAAGVVVAPPANTDEAFRYEMKAGGNTLAASGTVAIDFDFAYTLPNGGREALVTINLVLVDAQGSSATKTVQVRVV